MRNFPEEKNMILIGIDGGATKLSGWLVEFDRDTELFRQGTLHVEKRYRDYPGYKNDFIPVDLKTQLREMETGIRIQPGEKKQAGVYKSAAVDVLVELLEDQKGKKGLVGIGMPGLKTKDLRGIAVIANGPRMPGFCDFLEKELKKERLELKAPVARIGSDADYCGLGEEYSVSGLFRDVANAYYLGGGTGVADAMKLNGKIVRFDEAGYWIAKAWEMKSSKGHSLEHYTSASGIQKIYSYYSGIPVQELNRNHIFPTQILEKAMNNEEAAYRTMKEVGEHLALLLFERILTVYSGWSDIFSFVNPARKKPVSGHEYRGILLDRIIIGQRLGDLLSQSPQKNFLRQDVERLLGEMIFNTNDSRLISHFLSGKKFRRDLLQTSGLREAPALGAGIDAYLNHYKP